MFVKLAPTSVRLILRQPEELGIVLAQLIQTRGQARRVPAFVPSATPRLQFVSRLARDKSGVAAIEYALLASLIAIAIITGAENLGKVLGQAWDDVAEAVSSALDDSGDDGNGGGGGNNGNGNGNGNGGGNNGNGNGNGGGNNGNGNGNGGSNDGDGGP